MVINESTYVITSSQYDWGVPVIFDAGVEQGFSLGDKIVFSFASENIADRIYTVNTEDFSFELALTREEANAIFPSQLANRISIDYSAKRYVKGSFLETLLDSKLIIQSTVQWEGENNG